MPEASNPDGGIEITDGLGYFVGNFPIKVWESRVGTFHLIYFG